MTIIKPGRLIWESSISVEMAVPDDEGDYNRLFVWPGGHIVRFFVLVRRAAKESSARLTLI